MALTADRYLETLAPGDYNFIKRSGPAVADTYYVGQELMKGGDDGLVKPLSASAVAGTVCVGWVKEKQTVSNDSDNLNYVAGPLALSGSGITGKEDNAIVYLDGTGTAFASQGSARIPAGKLLSYVSGSETTNGVMADVGTVVSGS